MAGHVARPAECRKVGDVIVRRWVPASLAVHVVNEQLELAAALRASVPISFKNSIPLTGKMRLLPSQLRVRRPALPFVPLVFVFLRPSRVSLVPVLAVARLAQASAYVP